MNYEDAIAIIRSAPASDASPVLMDPVEIDEISEAETELGRTFPADLKKLWQEVGYGDFKAPLKGGKRTAFVNRLMHPGLIVETYQTYSEEYGDSIPFFDVADEDYLLIEKDGWIRHSAAEDMLVANSLRDFIERLADDPLFWTSGDYLVRENVPDAR